MSETKRKKVFEIFNQSLESLRRIPIEPIQKMVKLFDEAAQSGQEISPDTQKFQDALVSMSFLNQEFKKILPQANKLNLTLQAANTAMTQSSRLAKSVKNIIANASLGAGNMDEAFNKVSDRIESSKDSLLKFENLLSTIQTTLKQTKLQFGTTNEFKSLEEISKKFGEITAQLKIDIDNAQAQREGIRIVSIISEQFGALPKQVQKNINLIGSAFRETVKKSLTGELRSEGKTAFTQLADDFRNVFIFSMIRTA